jgi:hypothetical protein
LEVEEAGEEVVDGSGGLEVGEAAGEFGGEILGAGLLAFVAKAYMAGAENGGGMGDAMAAAAAFGSAVLTAG